MSGAFSTSGTDPAVLDAQAASVQGVRQAGEAYSNYRQFQRDNYANQLSNQSSLYQGLMNRMAAAGDSSYSPNTAQMSNNPMSQAQTMVGAVQGSNAAGTGFNFGDTDKLDANGHLAPQVYGLIGQTGLRTPGKYEDPGYVAPATLDINGKPLPQQQTQAQLNNINTNNVAPPAPQQTSPGQSGPSQFSFAPRRP